MLPNLRWLFRLAYRGLAPVSSAFRARARGRSRDATGRLTRGTALVLAPHADDETLGCGGVIARKVAAREAVHVVIATDGSRSHDSRRISPAELAAIRHREALEAARLLGLTEDCLTFLGHPDGGLHESLPELEAELTTLIRVHQPDQVFVASSLDGHTDHRALARAARAAVTRAAFRGELFEYPVWYWERLPWMHRPRSVVAAAWFLFADPVAELLRPPGVRISTSGYLETKASAIRAYRSQTTPFPADDDVPLLGGEFLQHFLQADEVFHPVPADKWDAEGR